jgi:hypothetical protein
VSAASKTVADIKEGVSGRENPAPKARLPEISALEVCLCLFAIYIHVAANTVSGRTLFTDALFISKTLVRYVVQGFIFIAALKYELSRRREVSYPRYLLTRLRRVLPQYFLWNAVYYIFFVFNDRYRLPFSLVDFAAYVLRGDLVAHLYFVLIITQFYVLAPAIRSLTRKIPAAAGIPAAAALTLGAVWLGGRFPSALMWDRVFVSYLIYWVAGTYAGRCYDSFRALSRRFMPWLSAVFVFSAVAHLIISFRANTGVPAPAIFPVIELAFKLSGPVWLLEALSRLRYSAKTLKIVQTLHGAVYTAYLSHPFALFLTQLCFPPGTVMLTRFFWLTVAGTIPPFALGAALTAAKNALKKLKNKPGAAASPEAATDALPEMITKRRD